MKTRLLTLAALLLSLTAFGQLNPIQLGVQVSPSFSYMGTDNNIIEGNGTKLGLKLGLIGEYYFQDNYSIHTGINVHFGAGGKLRYDDEFLEVNIWESALADNYGSDAPAPAEQGGATFDYKLQFVEIPLGLTLRTREFGYMRYFVRPQVALGIMTGSKGSLEDVRGINSDDEFKINDHTNFLNLSWGIGGGVEYAVSTQTSLIGGLMFQSGFLDLTKDKDTSLIRRDFNNNDEYEDDSKGRMNSVTIMLGVMF
jgi:hypothetical protein